MFMKEAGDSEDEDNFPKNRRLSLGIRPKNTSSGSGSSDAQTAQSASTSLTNLQVHAAEDALEEKQDHPETTKKRTLTAEQKQCLCNGALASFFLSMTAGAMYYFVTTWDKGPVQQNWCPDVSIRPVSHVPGKGDGLKYTAHTDMLAAALGEGPKNRRGVVRLTRRQLYKTERGRKYIFLVYHWKHLYAFRISVYLNQPIRLRLKKFSKPIQGDASLEEKEMGLIEELESLDPVEDFLNRDMEMAFEPEWFVFVELDTAAATVESNLCTVAQGCQLRDFSLPLIDKNVSASFVRFTDFVLPEKDDDTVKERAVVILSCSLFEGDRRLCRLNGSGSLAFRC